jgi:DNA polymerase
MQSKQEQLKKLNQEMFACSRCALRSGCLQIVPGFGNVESKIFFIGEAPGQKEDEAGLPFVGASGKFLDEMLAEIKLERKNIFIANIIKCRPVKNRDPFPDEIFACWSWLLAQINIIKPKLIITLGRHSMERFFPEFKISQIHGKELRKEIDGIGQQVFFALYHPAAALYNGSMRKILISDFQKIPKLLQKIEKGQ